MFLQVYFCPWDRCTPPRQTPPRQTPLPETTTVADDTHPTGIHSCKSECGAQMLRRHIFIALCDTY